MIVSLGVLLMSVQAEPQETLRLENDRIGLSFARKTGALVAVENKLATETYQVQGDEFEVEAVQFRVGLADARLVGLAVEGDTLRADYRSNDLVIRVLYTLRDHFAEKQMTLTSRRDYGLKKLIVTRLRLSGPDLKMLAYRYPKFGRKPGEEPCCTFFGRTPRGGFFTGMEVPFDASSLADGQVILGYSPSLKVKAQEELKSEPAYLGVYRRLPDEPEPNGLPRRSESDAMVAMASAVLGPPRFGLVPMACGWHCEMEHGPYTEQSLTGDLKSLDFLAECGIDWVSDSHPWGGETQKMNALGASDKYEPGPPVRRFLAHAQKAGIKVAMWLTMTNTHPWGGGKPFRADKPEWLMAPLSNGNCMGSKPFVEWLARVNGEGLATGCYKSWVMDGDFFGGMGWHTTIVPVRCPSDQHDHLPGDSNYACQRALGQLIESVRKQHPDTYIWACRPPQDLGIWALRNVDAGFTLVELGTAPDNLAAGNEIRTWSRTRVHRDFFPHYLDQPLVFLNVHAGSKSTWLKGHLDYILLSALSSSPNQLYYIPAKTGIPNEDKAEIRRWLDWGRKNVEYLKVRKDLPDWPAAGKVDGSAHVVGDRGLVFLFNPGKAPLQGEFALTKESTGLNAKGAFQVTQEYPASDRRLASAAGQTVRWDVPPETAVVLWVRPAGP